MRLLPFAPVALAGVFDFVPAQQLFTVCHDTLGTVLAESRPGQPVASSVEPVCYKFIADVAREQGAKTMAVMDHCEELAGRVAEEEATSPSGRLESATPICAAIVREDMAGKGQGAELYLPYAGPGTNHTREPFCAEFVNVPACQPEEGPTVPPAADRRATWDSMRPWGVSEAAQPPPPVEGVTTTSTSTTSTSTTWTTTGTTATTTTAAALVETTPRALDQAGRLWTRGAVPEAKPSRVLLQQGDSETTVRPSAVSAFEQMALLEVPSLR